MVCQLLKHYQCSLRRTISHNTDRDRHDTNLTREETNSRLKRESFNRSGLHPCRIAALISTTNSPSRPLPVTMWITRTGFCPTCRDRPVEDSARPPRAVLVLGEFYVRPDWRHPRNVHSHGNLLAEWKGRGCKVPDRRFRSRARNSSSPQPMSELSDVGCEVSA